MRELLTLTFWLIALGVYPATRTFVTDTNGVVLWPTTGLITNLTVYKVLSSTNLTAQINTGGASAAQAATNGLAVVLRADLTNHVNTSTNGFTTLAAASNSILPYVTNLVADATNGLGGGAGITLAQATNGTLPYCTNLVTDATNNLAVTLRSDLTNHVSAATNGFVTSTITNGLATTNFVATALGGYVQGTNLGVVYLTNSNNKFSGSGAGLLDVPFYIYTNYAAGPTNFIVAGGLGFSPLYGVEASYFLTNITGIGEVVVRSFGIDTNAVITTNGGTFIGQILDNSASSAAPSSNQLVTAGWVRNLTASAGAWMYPTTNLSATATNAGYTDVYNFSYTAPDYTFARVYSGTTNGQYIGAVVTTNTFQQMQGPVSVNTYLAKGSSGTISVKPEIYYSYDQTNWYGDWDAGAQSISTGTNLYTWLIDVPVTYTTNATGFYVQRRFKVVSVTASASVTVVGGTNGQSHTTIIGPNSGAGNAFLAANQTFTGNNYFVQPLVGPGTGLTNAAGQYYASSNVAVVHATNATMPYIAKATNDFFGAMNSLVTLTPVSGTTYVIPFGQPVSNYIAFPGGNMDFVCSTNRMSASTNQVARATVTVMAGDGARTLTFNANWIWMGSTNNPPTSLAAGKVGTLILRNHANLETNVIAAWSSN